MTVIQVAGDLDMASAPALSEAAREELSHEQCRTLVLNLEQLEFLDSTGLGCFVQLHNHANQLAKVLQLQEVPAPAQRVLTLGGLASLFGLDSASPE